MNEKSTNTSNIHKEIQERLLAKNLLKVDKKTALKNLLNSTKTKKTKNNFSFSNLYKNTWNKYLNINEISRVFESLNFSRGAKKNIGFATAVFIGFALISAPFGFLYFYASNFSDKSLAKNVNSSASYGITIVSNSKSSSKAISSSKSAVNSSNQASLTDVSLKIDLIKQKYKLSCEAASLQMALKYYGIEKTQDELSADFGSSKPLKIELQNNEPIWGDPELGFVGDVNGNFKVSTDYKENISKLTGWGASNTVVAKASNKYRANSISIKNGSITDINTALQNKQPVIFWHQRDDAPQGTFTYKTTAGKQVTMITNHVALIVGMKKADQQKTVYSINDPIYGQYELEENELLRLWSKYNKDIVIVK